MESLKDFSLEGKNAWITGASYGIGFNIAKAFVAAGVKNIIFNDINQEALERGLANYKEAGITNVKGYVCNVCDEVAVAELVKKIHEEVGGLNLARCITKRECSWLDYWLVYGVLIINLIDEIFEKLV